MAGKSTLAQRKRKIRGGKIELTQDDSISNRLSRIARQYSEALQRRLGGRLITVALFGSVARNEATPFSDIDLLLIIKGLPRGRFARMDLLEPVNDEIECIWKG